jgi:cbb3-type cytochrome oxidase subunit 3
MSFKTVFISMALTLVLLFIWSHFYQKKEKSRTRIEGDYYFHLREYKKSPNDELKNQVIELGIRYGLARGFSEEDARTIVDRDLSIS